MAKEFVHTDLLNKLREVFVSGEFSSGTKVPEALLCERFGVSRTPLREALKVLGAEGHVELLPNRGARVRELSIEEVEGLFAVAGALEALAGEQAADRVSAEELAEITLLHERMRSAYAARDLSVYYELNRGVHEAVVQAARNPVLLAQYAVINARIRRIRFNSPMTQAIWSRAMAEHEGMLNALARRDAGSLSGILKTHLRHKCEAILAAMKPPLGDSVPGETSRSRRKEPSA
ncbi:GntR family transcriptional regulator [Polaromonas sp. SM01]|uniref:GntR family transcriptional regulator n=1 Tax=Polaromonas sp. SM01 TaxID=3085630 RepID=UPI002981398F|nr:GntR family transcriptional regulator [Polaromonas sp. SM01]MDW5442902.1 GntR family transcriptional regulator [Polaromonas sp. SM01]